MAFGSVTLKKSETPGERRIIEIIQNCVDLMPKMSIPFGDDVSAYDIGNGRIAVLKTDMLVDKTDVPSGMSLWQAARKAVVMNISDFAAKGVAPKALLVSLGLPRGTTEKDVEAIGEGLNAGAREFGAYIVGGDTGEASDLVISISLFGIGSKDKIMLRSGAKPGDLVAVTGSFGKPPAGLRILLEGSKVGSKFRWILVDSVLMPHARLKEGLALGGTKAVSASIDSSDGLAWSLHELSRSSGVGFVINSLPIALEAKEFAEKSGVDVSELVLYGGEEYELVLTVRPNFWEKAEKAVERVGGSLLAIGKVTSDRNVIARLGRKGFPIEARGYEHLRS